VGERAVTTRSAGLILALVAAVSTLLPVAAAAHPLGSPAFLLVEQTGDRTLTLTWTPAPDDWVVVARSVGVPVGQTWPDPVPADASLTASEQRRLATDPATAAYLEQRLQVRQDGRRCPGTVALPERLDDDSPVVTVTCPRDLEVVDVTVTTLVDVDARYRTTLVAPGERRDARASLGADTPTVTLDLAAGTATPQVAPPSLGGALSLEQRLTQALTGASTPWAAAVVLGFGLLLGAVHGLAPGHGKAITAAYLVGTAGRARDAVALGAAVALMHTGSVIVLGLVLWGASARLDLTAVGGGLRVVTGIAVVAVGVWLVVRSRRQALHDHAHGHSADHGDAALSAPRLIALATAGGLLPSPTAAVVLLTAFTLGRPELGIGTVAAFSLGLAAMLTTVGLGVVWGRDRLTATTWHWPSRLARHLPLGAGLVLVVLGVVIAVTA
jgi:nickel/cobalt transporter (NicO) family protein